jgi:DNA repair photolyase
VPGITDAPADLEAVIRAASDAGADYVFANPLFLKPCSAAVFIPFLEQNFPHLAASYRECHRDRSFLAPAYGKRLSQLVGRLKEKYKLTRAHRQQRSAFATKWPVQQFEEQLDLF